MAPLVTCKVMTAFVLLYCTHEHPTGNDRARTLRLRPPVPATTPQQDGDRLREQILQSSCTHVHVSQSPSIAFPCLSIRLFAREPFRAPVRPTSNNSRASHLHVHDLVRWGSIATVNSGPPTGYCTVVDQDSWCKCMQAKYCTSF